VDNIITFSKTAVHSLTRGEAKSPVRTYVSIMQASISKSDQRPGAIVVFKRGRL